MDKYQKFLTTILLASLAGCGGGSSEGSDLPSPSVVQKISLLAGVPSGSGNQDGETKTAHYDYKYGMGGLAVRTDGEIIFSDTGNNTIRKISKDGIVSTIAGSGAMLDEIYYSNSNTNHADGIGSTARFYEPKNLTLDLAGNIYVIDKGNNVVRKIDISGNVITLTGKLGQCGYDINEDAGRLCRMNNIAIDLYGNVYLAEEEGPTGNPIKKISPTGVVSTLTEKASNYRTPYISLQPNSYKYFPVKLAVDAKGDLYAADPNDKVIKKYINGKFEVFSGTLSENNGGYVDGTAAEVKFSSNITEIAFNKRNQMYVLDDKRIRKVGIDGSATTALDLSNACSILHGSTQPKQACRFENLAFDDKDNFLLEEKGFQPNNNDKPYNPYSVLRRFALDGSSSVVVGKEPMALLFDGNADVARFFNPSEMAIAPSGTIHVWDAGNRVIRKISEAGQTSTLGTPEKQCDLFSVVTAGETKKIQDIGSCHFKQLTTDRNNNIYTSTDGFILKISPSGDVSMFSDLSEYSIINEYYSSVAIQGMAISEDGTMYVSYTTADASNAQKSAIFKIANSGKASLFAGSLNTAGHRDGLGVEALFTNPKGIALDSKGNLYVLDDAPILPSAVSGPTLRKITPSGEVTTVAGKPYAAPGLEDGDASKARFTFSKKENIYLSLWNANLALDAQNNIYITDPQNSVIRKVTPTGKVSTFVGKSGIHGFTGGDLPGVINRPTGIAVHKDTLYFSMYNAVAKINLK